MLKFYDYSVDAILRAFEDRGLDSDKVFIGGIELAAPFPNLYRLDEFLTHCTPNGKTDASLNYAFADKRLDGKRSRRVDSLCRAHGGKGTPLDFASIHIYRASAAAEMLIDAKSKALAIDPEYYKNLWTCSHETCPDWLPSPDLSYNDMYLGNGYYPAWCADYVWRQLRQGAKDPRYAMGNTVMSYFPWPNQGFPFGLTSGPTQIVKVDDNGDGQPDRQATLRTPIYHFFNVLGSLGEHYWVLPEKKSASHAVAGFAGRGPQGELRLLLYSLDPTDLQGRAGQELEINVNLAGFDGRSAKVTQYRFDRTHNSYFELARKIQMRIGQKLSTSETPEERLQAARQSFITADELSTLEQQVALRAEPERPVQPAGDGRLRVPAALADNGATLLVIEGND
jgi:hypothetical protein